MFFNFRLICDPNLQFNFKFTIKEADSQHQPKIDGNTLKFEEINDDCLLKIASYLELIDIVNLGKTSTRLQAFANQIYRKKSHFSFGTNTGDSSINDSNLRITLKEMGHYIKTIEWHGLNSNHLDKLSRYCSNVTTLSLKHPSNDLHLASIKSNKTFFAKLKILDIQHAAFFDSALKVMISSRKLKSLQLLHCRNIRGRFFSTWNNSKLKYLKVNGSWKVDCEDIFGFLCSHKLHNFSFDAGCSFRQCLGAPSECLLKFKELELDFSFFTDDKLKVLNFGDLKRLTDLTVTRKYLGSVTSYEKCNNLLAAISQVDTLESLNIENIQIDGETVEHLGSFENLRKIRLNNVKNTIGKRLYTSIPIHLQKLTMVSMDTTPEREFDRKWICDMISTMNYLEYFSHNCMTWQLLEMILQLQLRRNHSTIEIGVSQSFLEDPRKVNNFI